MFPLAAPAGPFVRDATTSVEVDAAGPVSVVLSDFAGNVAHASAP